MKKVTITTRQVYHKIASVTIDVPSDVTLHDIQVWLWENQDLYQEEIDNELDQTPISLGLGLGNGMEDSLMESEHRFDFLKTTKTHTEDTYK